MTKIVFDKEQDGDPLVVELRDPYWAAFLAWIWPGAGHFYQRRFTKGFLFMICVLSTYFFGLLALGHGRVVYASFGDGDVRWQYIPQLAVGAPALPAIAQRIKTKQGGEPFFVLCERYPEPTVIDGIRYEQFSVIEDPTKYKSDTPTYKDGFMAPPAGPKNVNSTDVLGQWHSTFKHHFEMGTLYTVVAGLLNLLAIYDAFVGPAILTKEQRERLEAKQKNSKKKNKDGGVDDNSKREKSNV